MNKTITSPPLSLGPVYEVFTDDCLIPNLHIGTSLASQRTIEMRFVAMELGKSAGMAYSIPDKTS